MGGWRILMALTKITANIIEDGAITASALSDNSIGITQLNVSDGTSGQFLKTDGSGNLSFASVPAGYTDSDVESYLSGGTGVTFSSGVISIGQDVSTSATPTFGNITTTGYIAGPATFTIDPAAVGNNTGTVVIAGNLQVDGTTTTINSTTMEVDDLNITLASGAANAAAANGAGITVDGASATITYDGTNDEWDFNKDINITGTITSSGNITGTLATAAQPNITSVGSLTGLDVSGTPTFDGLTVDGNATLQGASSPTLNITDSDTPTTAFITATNSSARFGSSTNTDVFLMSNNTLRTQIDGSTGDISFYEDTGTTAKFFWDASAESLGIGTTSPVATLTSKNTGSLTTNSNDGDHTGFGLFLGKDTLTANTVNTAIGFGNTSSGRKYAAIGMQTYADADQ